MQLRLVAIIFKPYSTFVIFEDSSVLEFPDTILIPLGPLFHISVLIHFIAAKWGYNVLIKYNLYMKNEDSIFEILVDILTICMGKTSGNEESLGEWRVWRGKVIEEGREGRKKGEREGQK